MSHSAFTPLEVLLLRRCLRRRERVGHRARDRLPQLGQGLDADPTRLEASNVAELTGRELRVEPMKWLRGPAKLGRALVELDRERARPYTPMEEAELMYVLAAIRRPSDALAFVQRYGLLHHGDIDGTLRERVSDIEAAAIGLSTALDWWILIQRSASDDRQESNDAIRQAWTYAERIAEGFDTKATTDAELITQAAQLVAFWTNQGLVGVDFKVQLLADERGMFRDFALSAHSPTLLGAAYHQLALAITQRIPLRSCEECGRKFAVRDRRQRFCSTTCGSRARQRRFANQRKGNS